MIVGESGAHCDTGHYVIEALISKRNVRSRILILQKKGITKKVTLTEFQKPMKKIISTGAI